MNGNRNQSRPGPNQAAQQQEQQTGFTGPTNAEHGHTTLAQGLRHPQLSAEQRAVLQDFDALLFGTPRLLRNVTVTGRRKLPGKQVWVDVKPEEIRLAESLDAAGLSREQLVDAALLVGTDFNPGIKGIGPKKALALIQAEGSLEALIERLSADPESATKAVERSILEQHEALMDRDAIRGIFLQPEHADVELEKGRADGDAVRQFMVKERGFSQERVDGALRRFDVAAEAKKQTGLFEFGA